MARNYQPSINSCSMLSFNQRIFLIFSERAGIQQTAQALGLGDNVSVSLNRYVLKTEGVSEAPTMSECIRVE